MLRGLIETLGEKVACWRTLEEVVNGLRIFVEERPDAGASHPSDARTLSASHSTHCGRRSSGSSSPDSISTVGIPCSGPAVKTSTGLR